ncbi:ankyrin repeat-containing domain protein [Trichoderma velutinum]
MYTASRLWLGRNATSGRRFFFFFLEGFIFPILPYNHDFPTSPTAVNTKLPDSILLRSSYPYTQKEMSWPMQYSPQPAPGISSSRLTDCDQGTPIRYLWNSAYDALREEDGNLIKKYEAKLRGNLTAGLGSTMGQNLGRRDWMHAILKCKMDEVEKSRWKLNYGESEIVLNDIAQSISKVINSANQFITAAVSSNPSASLAWAGVSVLLPLFSNPEKQAESLAKGLEYISSLIVQSQLRDEIYSAYYESESGEEQMPAVFHRSYKDSLQAVYKHVLRFLATSYCYYNHKTAIRLGSDIFKRYDWKGLMEEIYEKEREFGKISGIWHDERYNQERSVAESRHREIMESSRALGEDVSSLKKITEDDITRRKRKELLQWLSDIDPSAQHNTALERHEDGTSRWLLQDDTKFKNWITSPKSILWLHGKAGSGKSILSSSVISYLQEEHKFDPFIAVAYFYFSFNDAKKQKKDEMLASLIKQICCHHPYLPEATIQLDILKDRQFRPDFKTLEKALIGVMKELPAVYIVIDAIDECPTADDERNKLMKSLGNIIRGADDNLHLFCTSRKETDISTVFYNDFFISAESEIDISSQRWEITKDMERYIDSTLASPTYSAWGGDIKAEAKKTLIKKSDGMFQYIRCQLETLRELYSPRDIRNTLQDLPEGLDDTYERMLQNIDPRFQKNVLNSLKWLCFSISPLTLDELAEIFILQPDEAIIINEADRFSYTNQVLNYFPGLVLVEGSFVRLAHFSIKEYLTSGRVATSIFVFNEMDAHILIGRSCVAYLLYVSAMSSVVKEFMIINSKSRFLAPHPQYRLLFYAASKGLAHPEIVPLFKWPPALIDKAMHALTPKSPSLYIMLRSNTKDSFVDQMLLQPYRYTAWCGFLKLTNLLVSQEYCKYSKYLIQGDLNAALMDAEGHNKKEVMQLLLDKCVSIGTERIDKKRGDVHSRGWRSAIQAAVFEGNLDILKLLVNHKTAVKDDIGYALFHAVYSRRETGCFEFLLKNVTDINWQDLINGVPSALYAAARFNNWTAFDVLLESGADINLSGCWGSPLYGLVDCAYTGDERDVILRMRRLLDLGADPNLEHIKYGTALESACNSSHSLRLVKLLIEYDADVNAAAKRRGTALRGFIDWGYISLAQLLLKNGADVNSQGGKHGSALQAACARNFRGNNLEVIQLLLDYGADVNMHSGKHGSALQAACSQGGSFKIIQLLLEHGADVTVQGSEYSNALQAACQKGATLDVVQLLLQHGADVNSNGKYGNALQAACGARATLDVVQLLLNSGADVNANGKIGTALQIACAREGYLDVIQLLLDSGADVNVEGGKYGSALQAAAFQGSCLVDKVNLLLDHGANVNIGGTLQLICRRGESAMDIVRLLLDRKKDMDLTGAWHAAVASKYTKTGDLLQLLLDHGANINSVSGASGTALHVALSLKQFSLPRHIDFRRSRWIARVRFLLQHGADVNRVGGKYGFPLQSVCAIEMTCSRQEFAQSGNKLRAQHYLKNNAISEMVTILLEEYPNIEVNAHGGVFGTALQAAAYSGQTKSIQLLLKHGAYATCCDNRCGKYKTALNAAVIRGHWHIAELLLQAGAIPDCHFLWQPDEAFMMQIQGKHGESAKARYLRFWEVQKSLYKERLLAERGRIALGYNLMRLWLLFYLQLLCSFVTSTTGHWTKKMK